MSATPSITERPIDVVNTTVDKIYKRSEMLARFCEAKAEVAFNAADFADSQFWSGLMEALDENIIDCTTLTEQVDQLWCAAAPQGRR